MRKLTKCPNDPIYGLHVTNGFGPDALCVYCGKPVREWRTLDQEVTTAEKVDA